MSGYELSEEEYINPKWDCAHKCHDWRNYIHDAVKDMWPSFTVEQKKVLAHQADVLAGKEEWE